MHFCGKNPKFSKTGPSLFPFWGRVLYLYSLSGLGRGSFLLLTLPYTLAAAGLLASQIISNVPAAMLLSGYSGDLKELIVGTNIGGLGTLIASMASLISYKQVAGRYPALKRQCLATFTLCNLVFLAPLSFL